MLHLETATELIRLYRTKQASPVEATRAMLAQIHKINPVLNAFCLVDEEQALAQAQASEARWLKGEPKGLLDGVPVAIKDLILTKGWPTLRGSRTIAPNQDWPDDAPSVERLKEHGAVIVGKTTTPEFGCKGSTDSFLTGITRNPWNPEKTSGGSSGGSAAAVSAGMVPLAMGTDGAGSIRIPAAFCGGFGIKPSFGRVPAWPASPFGTVAHLGPHTRSVEDAALMLTVISQPDPRDWLALPYDPRDYRVGLSEGVRNLRVAFSPDLGYVRNVHPEIASSVRKAAQVFAELGANVEEISPGFENPSEITDKLWFVGSATLYNAVSPEQRALIDPDFSWQAEQGNKVSVMELQALNKRRAEIAIHMRKFHQRYDLLLTPAVSIPAFRAVATGESNIELDGFLDWTPFSYPFNLTQQPACAIPCGLTQEGLPISLQIVGPNFADALVLRAARAFESIYPIAMPALSQ